jgi:hypothetical protein
MTHSAVQNCTFNGSRNLLKTLLVLFKYEQGDCSKLKPNYTQIANEAFSSQSAWNDICEFLDQKLPSTEDLCRQSPISLFSTWRTCSNLNQHHKALCTLWFILKKKDAVPTKFYNKLHQEFEQYLVSFYPYSPYQNEYLWK